MVFRLDYNSWVQVISCLSLLHRRDFREYLRGAPLRSNSGEHLCAQQGFGTPIPFMKIHRETEHFSVGKLGLGEVARCLKAVVVLEEDLGPTAWWLTNIYNLRSRGPKPSSDFYRH